MLKRHSLETRTKRRLVRLLWFIVCIGILLAFSSWLSDYLQPVISPIIDSTGVTVIFLSPTPGQAP